MCMPSGLFSRLFSRLFRDDLGSSFDGFRLTISDQVMDGPTDVLYFPFLQPTKSIAHQMLSLLLRDVLFRDDTF
jgi:hypothetical protein